MSYRWPVVGLRRTVPASWPMHGCHAPARAPCRCSSSSTASSPSDAASSITPSPPGSTSLRTVQQLHPHEWVPTLKRVKSETRLPTVAQIREAMVNALASKQARRALQIFLNALARREDDRLPTRTVDGLAWLFCQYRQPALARQAAAALHDQGYNVTPKFASKLLRMSRNDLILQPDHLANVLSWLSQGMLHEKTQGGKDVDEGMLETVLDVLKRMGRSDWLMKVFEAYRATLDAGKPGSPRLWGLAISAKANEGDVRAAQALFSRWRGLYEAEQRTSMRKHASSTSNAPAVTCPPSHPYLALLHHFSAGTTYIASRDPAYKLVAVMTEHGVLPSTDFLNALLRTELHRRRWPSFWGLWAQFEALAVARNEVSWALAIKAKVWHDAARRQRARLHASPLHAVAPFTYTELMPPPARALFRSALSDRLESTQHRPSRVLSTKEASSLSPGLLNLFLDLFVTRRDWAAATVVLETFRVHRMEPDARTHAAVVLGMVRLWELGKLDAEPLTARDPLDPKPDRFDHGDVFDENFQARLRRRAVLGGAQSLELIRQILEGRKMRVGLWTGTHPQLDGGAAPVGPGIDDSAQGVDVGTKEEAAPASPPAWMTQREMRDLGYLATLLRRCADRSEDEWAQILHETREEMLPRRTSLKVKKVKRLDRGVRFREQAYGKAFKVKPE